MQRRWLNEHRQCRLIEWIMNRILIFFSIATLSTPPLALIAPPEHDEALCRLFFFFGWALGVHTYGLQCF